MATYVPNATQTTEPVESRTVESAALEFRTLKESVNTRIAALTADFDALEAVVTAEDAKDLRVPEAAVAPLPAIAARAGKVLAFDAGGDPTVLVVGESADSSLRTDLAAPSGSSLVGYTQAGTGAVAATVEEKLREVSVSVRDFGARPSNTAAQNDVAFAAAIAHMNAAYAGVETILSATPAKGALIVPADGIYQVSTQFVITGNYSFLMFGTVKYSGPAGSLVFKIAKPTNLDQFLDLSYVLNLDIDPPVYPAAPAVDAFELVNMVSCNIIVNKISNANDAVRCVANIRGFFANKLTLGTFSRNATDIRLHSIGGGSPNANFFYGGMFYKRTSATYAQYCVRISSDGQYVGTETNYFDGCNFEEGEATGGAPQIDAIPIYLEVGEFNSFINIRAENTSATALALVSRPSNVIKPRNDEQDAYFSTSFKVISRVNQQTLTSLTQDLLMCYDSGSLQQNAFRTAGGTLFHNQIEFVDRNAVVLGQTKSAMTGFILSAGGITLDNSNRNIVTHLKVNGDTKFCLLTSVTDTAKRYNIGVKCYDSSGSPLALTNAALATDTSWGVDVYVKQNVNSPLINNANGFGVSRPAYTTGSTAHRPEFRFEVHPDVHYIDVFYFWGFDTSGNDVTFSQFQILSKFGKATRVRQSIDWDDYKVVNSNLYQQTVSGGTLSLALVS